MKTPLTYHGGKQQLASKIIQLIPEQRIYVEPFIGGGAIFWGKEPSEVEVINDTNGEIINFYEVLKRDFTALQQEVLISLHSQRQHRNASVIYSNPHLFTRIQRAWAVWILSTQSFGARLNGSFGYDRTGATSKAINNKIEAFTLDYSVRLQRVQIECADALRIIRSRDTPNTFFYCDPPYPETDQGHYDGYTQEDFDALLRTLGNIEGRFLLSSYRNSSLSEFVHKHGWHTIEIKMAKPSSPKRSQKIEVLTSNYPISCESKK